jgi:hypothetical protein
MGHLEAETHMYVHETTLGRDSFAITWPRFPEIRNKVSKHMVVDHNTKAKFIT